MAVVQYRLDGRMLHGQVSTFAKQVGADHFIVVNAAVAQDDTQIMLLELAAINATVDVCAPDELVDLIEEDDDSDRTMVVFKELTDVVESLDAGLECKEIFISGIYAANDREKVAACLFLNAKDKADLKYILDKGVNLSHQIQPDYPKKAIQDIVKL